MNCYLLPRLGLFQSHGPKLTSVTQPYVRFSNAKEQSFCAPLPFHVIHFRQHGMSSYFPSKPHFRDHRTEFKYFVACSAPHVKVFSLTKMSHILYCFENRTNLTQPSILDWQVLISVTLARNRIHFQCYF